MTGAVRAVRRHPWRTFAATVLVVLGVGAVMNRSIISAALLADDEVDLSLPVVEPLEAGPGETVYRIDPERSSATVHVTEELAGADNEVELVTHGIAGDVGVGPGADGRAASVRLGAIAVNVEQLESDNSLRDKMIRHEFLESSEHPEVRLDDATVSLPDDASATEVDGATIDGTLHVKGVDRPTTWSVDASVEGDTLTATATTTIKMSDFGVGPISKAGLVGTEDDMEVALRLTAVDGRGFEPPTVLASAVDDRAGDTSDAPSFSKEVQPILEQNCASCHERGAVGASMWKLANARDAADVADGLAVVTKAEYMPPWPPSDEGIELQHARGLTDEQISTIVDWAKAGAPLDVPDSTKVEAPAEPEVPLPRADVTLSLPEPYQGGPATKDDYRCFILDPHLTEPTFLTGSNFQPDQLQIVHHALVYQRPARAMADAVARDAADPGGGWSCATGMGGDSTAGALVGGWVPGQRPQDFGDGVGYEFEPGDFLVVQIHYHYDADAPPDRSTMALELSHDMSLIPLHTSQLIGPVEIPCPGGLTGGLCDRPAALADVAQRFGPGAAVVSDALNRICRTKPEELAATSDGVTATTTCDYRIREDGDIVDVLGHMHELGSSYRMTLNPDTAGQKVLLDIPTWDFDWQLNYQPVERVTVKKGDTIRVSCSWDRNLRFDPQPRYIVFAEGTRDEMCFSTVTIRPEG
ncbi:YceI family protein [Dermatobacter hominis]|uniref:YceI family protein n=1 Tax=Dermatobacter hominis TaxID=2884263 RepID=UPI001D10D8E0|nr:YceI family protein [Dermatobacter hominis]UDY37449.1 YceI family protein [Dermatobacter hominis]